MVMNLTNPRDHFETTKACLEAGKHVYSEKPLAMDSTAAGELASLARSKGLRVATAPCSLLGECAQTLWKGINDGIMGTVRLVYANFDDGMIHRHRHSAWRSASGASWPAKDEFEVGCTYEHAAYVLSWLAAYFGPARRIHGYASTRVKNKGVDVKSMAPDFTVGNIEYDNDIVARVTCSVVAPLNKSISIIGDTGTLYTKQVRNDASPVYFAKTPPNRFASAAAGRLDRMRIRMEQVLRLPFSISGLNLERKIPYARRPKFNRSGGNKPVDFMRGPAELADSIKEKRPCRLPIELGVHMIEIVETLQYPEKFESPRVLTTSFDPIEPLPWN
jgi:predicted dehydrogenase